MAPRDDDDDKLDEKFADMDKRQATHEAAYAEWKKAYEEKVEMRFATMNASLETVRQTANEGKAMASQALTSIEGIPSRVLEAIKQSNRMSWAEWRTWALFFFAAAGLFSTLLGIAEKIGIKFGNN